MDRNSLIIDPPYRDAGKKLVECIVALSAERAGYNEKIKQVAEEGWFIEYKRINDYWKDRIEGVKLPTEMVFLVGASPYRLTAFSIDLIKLSTVPEYARGIISKTRGGGFVYGITCKPIIVPREPAPAKQLQLVTFSPASDPFGA